MNALGCTLDDVQFSPVIYCTVLFDEKPSMAGLASNLHNTFAVTGKRVTDIKILWQNYCSCILSENVFFRSIILKHNN